MWLNAWVDADMLRSIELPPRSREALESFSEALQNKVHLDNLVIAPISNLANRDALAQIADFLLPTEGVEIVVCYGIRRGKIILSVRSSNDEIHVGRVLSKRFQKG